MKRFLKHIFVPIAIFASITGIVSAATLPASTGATFETYLASQQGTSDNTITLSSGAYRDGLTLSGYQCFVVDSNTSSQEYECGTASTTQPTLITGVTRGLDYVTGTTSEASQIFAHRRGADIKISDYPVLNLLNRILSGIDSLPSTISYGSSVSIATSSNQVVYASWVSSLVNSIVGTATSSLLTLNNTWSGTNTFSTNTINNGTPVFNGGATFQTVAPNTSVTPTQPNNIANKSYVDGVAIAGGVIASNAITGIQRVASSTQFNGINATTTAYAIPSYLASTTASSSSIIVATLPSTGLIDASFLPTFAQSVNVQTFTATSTTNTWTKPNGAKFVEIVLIGGGGGGGGGTNGSTGGSGGGGGGRSVTFLPASILGTTENVIVGAGGPGGTSGVSGTIGTSTSFGNWLLAGGGSPGTAGIPVQAGGKGGIGIAQGSTGSAGTAGTAAGLGGASGGGSTSSGSGTNGGDGYQYGAAGGGAGGSQGGSSNGGTGGNQNSILSVISGGSSGTTAGGNGGQPTNATSSEALPGAGGGGGGNGSVGAGGQGGQGGLYGGGGGGGGAGNGTSGAGGKGGDGIAQIITYF